MPRSLFPRRGASAVEMAFVAPLIFLLFFAGIEFSRANMMLNVADNAALEGARMGIIPGAESNDCDLAAQKQLDQVQVKNYTVNVSPSTITQTTSEVTVSVTIPLEDNLLPMSKFFVGQDLVRAVTLRREVE